MSLIDWLRFNLVTFFRRQKYRLLLAAVRDAS